MAERSKDSIIEEREELMVSPTGGLPTLRTAHFLKPSVASITGPISKVPSLSLSELGKWRSRVTFNGWRDPQKKWKTWVHHMHSSYQSVWKKAGICEAVMGSTYRVRINDDLFFGVGERWCSETNTFVFPWGEATITLEDMMILGGYSVLGDSVSTPLETRELREIEESLIEARKEVVNSKARKACQYEWINQFMESGRELEHEAFLALWLSRYVFPANCVGTIGKHVFPIAINLARGIRIALAPAVLASIYRDLGLLKETVFVSTELETKECKDDAKALTLWAPLQLVQIWAWERFPPLQPQPNYINSGEPRSVRWNRVKKLKLENLRSAIDSAGESFQWRPYAPVVNSWSLPKFYREKEEWVLVDRGLDEELESFARCLRVCELAGLDIIERYLPHRVAMQFGMDQDLPGCAAQSNSTPETAWNNYNRPIRDAKLYIPYRLFESDVTTRYLEWWNQSMLSPRGAIKGVVQRQRNLKISKRLPQSSDGGNGDNDASVPPEFPLKCNRVGAGDSVEEDNLRLVEMLRSRNKRNSFGKRPFDDGSPSLSAQSQSLSSSTADNGAVRKMESPKKPVEKIMQGEAAMEGSANEGEDSSYCTFEIPGLKLEARINKLERVVAEIKAARNSFEKPTEERLFDP